MAIEFGLVLACLLFIKRVMETTEVNLFKDEIIPTDADGTVISEEHLHIPDHTEVYEINGPYFFGIANRFEEVVLQTKEQPKVRIIRMRKVPFIDSTGIHNLTNLCEMSHREGVHIILSGVNRSPQEKRILRTARQEKHLRQYPYGPRSGPALPESLTRFSGLD